MLAEKEFFPEKFDIAVVPRGAAPLGNGSRHAPECGAGRAGRAESEEGLLVHDGAAHLGVEGNDAREIEGYTRQKLIAGVTETSKNLFCRFHIRCHVDADPEGIDAVLYVQNLDEGVRVSKGGRLRGNHEKTLPGGHAEIEDVRIDAGARIDNEVVRAVSDAVHSVEQLKFLSVESSTMFSRPEAVGRMEKP